MIWDDNCFFFDWWRVYLLEPPAWTCWNCSCCCPTSCTMQVFSLVRSEKETKQLQRQIKKQMVLKWERRRRVDGFDVRCCLWCFLFYLFIYFDNWSKYVISALARSSILDLRQFPNGIILVLSGSYPLSLKVIFAMLLNIYIWNTNGQPEKTIQNMIKREIIRSINSHESCVRG